MFVKNFESPVFKGDAFEDGGERWREGIHNKSDSEKPAEANFKVIQMLVV